MNTYTGKQVLEAIRLARVVSENKEFKYMIAEILVKIANNENSSKMMIEEQNLKTERSNEVK